MSEIQTAQTTNQLAAKPSGRRWNTIRWVLAIALTFVLLPLPLAQLVVGIKLKYFPARMVAACILGFIAIPFLTFRLAYSWKPHSRWALGSLLGLTWIACSCVLVILRTGNGVPWFELGPTMGASTIWALWLTWLWAFPIKTSQKMVSLIPLFVWAFGFWSVYDIEGLDGSSMVEFVRKQHSEKSLSAESKTVITTNDIKQVDLTADSFPSYLGPNRNASLTDRKLTDWKSNPPIELWRRPVGKGWSGFAASVNFAFTQEQRGSSECVVCYDIATGDEVWLHSDDTAFESVMAGDGPRACPTVVSTTDADGNTQTRILTVGAKGHLNCLVAATGESIWQQELMKEFSGDNLVHGSCGSPLVMGDQVIVCPTREEGPCLAAYRLADGERVWSSSAGNQQRRQSYSSPTAGEFFGEQQIVLYNGSGVSGFDPETGKELWFFAWSNQYDNNASQPIIANNQVMVSTGYGKGTALLKIERSDGGKWSAKPIWECRNLKSKYSTPVEFDSAYYGLDDGIFSCVDKANGKKLWKRGRYGHGQILLVGEHIVVQCEKGELALVKPSKNKFEEIARIPALSSKTWNHLCLSGNHLLVRNDREAVCFKVLTE